jgi:hypothetical protein
MKLKLKTANISIHKDYKNGGIDKCGVVFLGRLNGLDVV